jgi:hypothetical protein
VIGIARTTVAWIGSSPKSWFIDVCETGLNDESPFLRTQVYMQNVANRAEADCVHTFLRPGLRRPRQQLGQADLRAARDFDYRRLRA